MSEFLGEFIALIFQSHQIKFLDQLVLIFFITKNSCVVAATFNLRVKDLFCQNSLPSYCLILEKDLLLHGIERKSKAKFSTILEYCFINSSKSSSVHEFVSNIIKVRYEAFDENISHI